MVKVELKSIITLWALSYNFIPFLLEIGILSYNPACYNFIHNPNTEMEFYPLIRAKIEFHPFIRKERYPLKRYLKINQTIFWRETLT